MTSGGVAVVPGFQGISEINDLKTIEADSERGDLDAFLKNLVIIINFFCIIYILIVKIRF